MDQVQPEIRDSPVEVGSWNPMIKTGFGKHPKRWLALGFLNHPTVFSRAFLRDIGAWLSVKSFIWGHQEEPWLFRRRRFQRQDSRPCAGRWRLAFPCHGEFDRKSDQRSRDRAGCNSWERLLRDDAENEKAAYKETAGQESGAMVVYDTHQLSQTSSPHRHPLGCCHSWRGWFLLFLDRTQRLAPFTRSKTQAVSNGFLLKNLWGLEKRPCNSGSHNLFNFMKGTFTIYCEAVFMQGPNSECYACWNAKLLFFFMVQKTLGKCELGHDPFFWMFVGTKYGA